MAFAEYIRELNIHIIDLQELHRLRNTHQQAFVKIKSLLACIGRV
jgi:hypothetical protein